MIETGWYATPGDPTRGRFWDGATFTQFRDGAATPYPEFPGETPIVPEPGTAFVAAPAEFAEPTAAVPVVVDEYSDVGPIVPRGPDPASGRRGIAAAAIATAVIVAAALLIWWALQSSGPPKPYACGSSGISITEWNHDGVTFDNGTTGRWADRAQPETRSGLDATCAGVVALRNATPSATTTTPSTSVTTTSPPVTVAPTRPVPTTALPATAPPRALTTAPLVAPPMVALGRAALLGNQLGMSVTGAPPSGASRLAPTADGTPPVPAPGNRFVVVTVRLTNATASSIAPAAIDFKLVDPTTRPIASTASSAATSSMLDLSASIPPGGSQEGDLVFEVPAAVSDSVVLRVATPTGSTYFSLR